MSSNDTANARFSLLDLLQVDVSALPGAARYYVTGIIGEGGMGKVYLGFDETLGRQVAIKVMLDEQDEGHAERFYREAKIMAALNHPNIIRIMDYSGPKSPRQFLVMERLAGHTLDHYIDQGAMPAAAALAVGNELASAFVHAHGVGVLHRDVKPENVFIEPNGRVVLLDFGLAKGLLADGDRNTLRMSETKLMGTPLFGSPEQCTGKYELTARSDIFSLGAVLYYALSQVYPFRGESLIEVIDAVVGQPHTPLSELVAIDPKVAAFIDKCLAKRPEDRYQTADEAKRVLDKLLQALRVSSPASTLASFVSGVPLPEREITGVGSILEERTSISRRASNPLDKTRIKTTKTEIPTGVTVVQRGKRVQPVGAVTEPSLPDRRQRRWLLWVGAAVLVVLGAVVGASLVVLQPAPAKPSGQAPVPAATTVAPPQLPVRTAEPTSLPAPVDAPQATAEVVVRVVVKPWGKVTIDGKLMGMTPSFRETNLTLGSHAVEVTHPTLGTKQKSFMVTPPETELVIDFSETK